MTPTNLPHTDDFPKHPDRETVVVEFDGTLNTWAGEEQGRAGGRDLLDPYTDSAAAPLTAAEFLEDLTDLNYRVVVLTNRPVDRVQQWLEDNDMGQWVAEVRNSLPPETIHAFVSSRTVLFNDDYAAAATAVDGLAPHWSA